MTNKLQPRRFHVEPLEERVAPVALAAVFTRATVAGASADVQAVFGPGNTVRLNALLNAGIGTSTGQAIAFTI